VFFKSQVLEFFPSTSRYGATIYIIRRKKLATLPVDITFHYSPKFSWFRSLRVPVEPLSLPLHPTLETHHPFTVSCQHGNIAITFFLLIMQRVCSAVTARPRKKFQHETGNKLFARTFPSSHFSVFCQIPEFSCGPDIWDILISLICRRPINQLCNLFPETLSL
jgi:hypothetical protein